MYCGAYHGLCAVHYYDSLVASAGNESSKQISLALEIISAVRAATGNPLNTEKWQVVRFLISGLGWRVAVLFIFLTQDSLYVHGG